MTPVTTACSVPSQPLVLRRGGLRPGQGSGEGSECQVPTFTVPPALPTPGTMLPVMDSVPLAVRAPRGDAGRSPPTPLHPTGSAPH